jgi:Pvc16 N-terminal domain
MSNFRAIATVTATLQRALQAAIQSDVAGATVSTVRPAEGTNTHLPTSGVNIYLYQVSQNPHRSNLDLPTRRSEGTLIQQPQIALDLHYLMSFYGDDLTLEPQRLLGSTVAFLHSQPLITRSQIEAVVADVSKAFLAQSDLANQPELVRFTPLTISLEELSRLWSVLLQVQYVLSVAYKASVVLVERNLIPQPALPTRTFNLAAIPLRQPYIQQVIADAGEGIPIAPGAAIRIIGVDLQGLATQVQIDSVPASTTEVSADHITLNVPTSLNAGPHRVQVVQGVQFDPASTPRMALASNPGVFVVHPAITQTAGQPDITISNVQGTGAAPRSASVTVGVAPAVGPDQIATLELLKLQQVMFTFAAAAPRTAAVTQLAFSLSGVSLGDYLFRVRVDGAESPLQLDANRVPIAPIGTIP